MAIAQEALHSMKTKRIGAAILKIDLKKAYDCLDWGYLRCLLIRIELDDRCTKWIMASVKGVNFAILINGYPTSFFSAERGLRQGCSLSPLLFILVMDTLNLQINKALSSGNIDSLSISRGNSITHNLFVDDVLLFAMLCRHTWLFMHGLLLSFQKATGLIINLEKSSFHFDNVKMEEMEYISQLYNIQAVSINEGIKYLGYHLKSTGYNIPDWAWITYRF